MVDEAKLNILERFGDGDVQDLVAEVKALRQALQEIVNASRDEGLAAMCNWMRGRAAAALDGE
jgi:hypothetical protein